MEITESKLKDILNEQNEGFRRHVDAQMIKQREEFQRVVEKEHLDTRHLFGIMKEDFSSKVELIGEQYGTIKEMMGALAEDMQIVKTDIEFMKGSLRKSESRRPCAAATQQERLQTQKARCFYCNPAVNSSPRLFP